jgi:hypothetical protein
MIVDVAASGKFRHDNTKSAGITGEADAEAGEYREHGAAKTYQPHFVPGPERTDRGDDLTAFLGVRAHLELELPAVSAVQAT